jgi:low affinity Fe/Cu permease
MSGLDNNGPFNGELMYTYPRSPFSRVAKWTAYASGHPLALVFAAATIGIWLISGPLFGFSDTWQLVINTGTTIVTFLMVFLIQNTQNRDSSAMHLKLDELIRTVNGAHNALLDMDELTEADLERLRLRHEALGRSAREDLRRGVLDTHTRCACRAKASSKALSVLGGVPRSMASHPSKLTDITIFMTLGSRMDNVRSHEPNQGESRHSSKA